MTTFVCKNCGSVEGTEIGEVQFFLRNDICEICVRDLYSDEDYEVDEEYDDEEYDDE